ncbi:MAG: methylmalonyl-CoA mutase family protein, partial [Gemmatimonadota bacterium]
QILAWESGAAATADPLGGSFYVERLTADLEERIEEYLKRIDAVGGAIGALEAGFFQAEIEREAWRHQRRVESGEEVVVGVNRWVEPEAEAPIARVDTGELAARQIEKLEAWRRSRDAAAVSTSLERLAVAARGGDNLVPVIRGACGAGATLGEIADVFREIYGTWDERKR